MKVLVINAGSSSIKYQVFNMQDESVLAKGLVDRVGLSGTTLEHKPAGKDSVIINHDLPDHTAGIKLVLEVIASKEFGVVKSMDEIMAVGHRVVHGGETFSHSVVIDQGVKEVIKRCFAIAPLHNPPNLAGIEACEALMPNIPQIAVFDTAFHQTMEPASYLYALPYDVYEKFKVRRYGFHGTSHYYVSQRAAHILGKAYEDCKIISLHLGNGASVAAIKDGKVLDTSMGFTPLEGLVMGTRSGDIDPALVYFLMEKLDMDHNAANNFFNKKSGILGLSGVSSDLRDIIQAAAAGNERAEIALQVYCNRVKGYIGNYIAKMNGCDCLVFTAGGGENGWEIRERICDNLDFLGIKINVEKNRVRGQELDVATEDSRVRILVIPTNEELVIARDTQRLAKEVLAFSSASITALPQEVGIPVPVLA